MKIFKHKHFEQKISDLKSELEKFKSDNEKLSTEIKGFYDADNLDNNLIKSLYSLGKMIDFSEYEASQIKDVYKTNSVVYGIIDRIASCTSELLRAVELQDGSGELITKETWALDKLLYPNDRDTGKKFIKAWAIERLIYGEAFVYAQIKIGSEKGKIETLYIMPAYMISIERGKEQPIIGIKLKYDNNTIPNENYFQSYTYNPDYDTFHGLSPLVVAGYDIQLLEKGMRRNNTSLNNGSVNTIITPARDKEGIVVPSVANELEDKLNDKNSVNKSIFVRQAIETHKIGSTPVELGIISTNETAIKSLCWAYNIPSDLYFGQSKYENAKEAKKALYQFAAIPLINEFLEDYVNYIRRVNKSFKYNLVLNTDKIEEIKISPTEVMNNLTSMCASLNEKRDYMGYAPIHEEWANKPILPLGTQFGNEFSDINEQA